ncbi:hypothetical protein [Burkholderia glumae]|uniref:hypothetical protein n=2 Tax=Burkholderia glumae TaxID=337 RepID=UPI0012956623|nr:hypothetical protein [Burkholderia glumae]MCM2493640.1 hypothetical protein [Burkholderia glumae]MCM2543739.1 hypothetical protein [Burkholderia glumae]MCM2547457.1 hypothetical protein [Burkholderia glumae]NVE21889.1 hypothetical protein [Burkholderia glumae]QGA38110.1 hypothetical protein GAS19_11115 [Burkholderia glumae]
MAFTMNRIAILNHMANSLADTALRIGPDGNVIKDFQPIMRCLCRSLIRHFPRFPGKNSRHPERSF